MHRAVIQPVPTCFAVLALLLSACAGGPRVDTVDEPPRAAVESAPEEPAAEPVVEPPEPVTVAEPIAVPEEPAAPPPAPPAASPDDEILATRIQLKLATEPRLALYDIAVESRGGAIVLRGAVGSAEERDLAETLARGTAGVRSVDNRLSID